MEAYQYCQLRTVQNFIQHPDVTLRLTPYADEFIGDHQCGFRRNKSTTDHTLEIRQIVEKIWQ